jgi:murein DD-endopeptidase MepM/ murein hydrolase activator NlpD
MTTVAAIGPLGAALVISPAAASASPLSSAKAQEAAIEARLTQLQNEMYQAALQYQSDQQQLSSTESQISAVQAQIASERQKLAQLKGQVEQEAVNMFVQAGSSSPLVDVMQGGPNSAAVIQEDVQTASSLQQQALAQYQQVKMALETHVQNLASLQKSEQNTLSAAAAQITSIRSDINDAHAQLATVSAQVRQIIQQQQAAEAAALAAEAQARLQAEQQAAAPPAQSYTPPASNAPAVNPNGYANPLRAVSDLQSWRIDQGVDFNGVGPVYAIGDGVITDVYNSGWPGGVYIAYQLTDGPAAGDYVYCAESISPTVSVGETVTPNTVIGNMFNGPYGIETGWANPGGDGTTMAMISGQFNGNNSTAYGYNFSQLLQALGGPGGVLQNPPTGFVASGWPSW